MSYKITLPNGTIIEAESLEDLSDVLSQLGIKPQGPPGMDFENPTVRASITAGQLSSFLSALEGAGEPLSSKDLAVLAGLKGPQALAGAMVTWRKILAKLGFTQADVAVNFRDKGLNQWSPGPRVSEAVEELDRRRDS